MIKWGEKTARSSMNTFLIRITSANLIEHMSSHSVSFLTLLFIYLFIWKLAVMSKANLFSLNIKWYIINTQIIYFMLHFKISKTIPSPLTSIYNRRCKEPVYYIQSHSLG